MSQAASVNPITRPAEVPAAGMIALTRLYAYFGDPSQEKTQHRAQRWAAGLPPAQRAKCGRDVYVHRDPRLPDGLTVEAFLRVGKRPEQYAGQRLPPEAESWTARDWKHYDNLIELRERYERKRAQFPARNKEEVARLFEAEHGGWARTRRPHSLSCKRKRIDSYLRRIDPSSSYFDGGIDRRGHKGGEAPTCSAEAWDLFKLYYLDPRRRSVTLCYEIVAVDAEKCGWNWPHVRSIQRKVAPELPPFIADRHRLGPIRRARKSGPCSRPSRLVGEFRENSLCRWLAGGKVEGAQLDEWCARGMRTSTFLRSTKMRSKDHFSPHEHPTSRPRRPIRPKAVRFISLLVCIGGAGLLAGCPACPADFEALFGREQPPAAVLAISPARGPVLGGTRVTILGTNTAAFGPGTDVLFGAFLASETEVVDESTIRATAPAQAAGHVDVIVRVASGSTVKNPDGFEYVAIADADGEIVAQIEKMFPGPPRLVSAVALNNTSARVTFSEPVREEATDASNYSIVIPEGGILLLDRSKGPELSDDQMVVDLTTLSQADAVYRVTVTGIHDLAGNTIAPPDMLVNPAETTFTGLAPANLDEHIDTDGDGLADWFEMLGWPITIELANGVREQGYVTSNPYNPDTDGDGVSDSEENARSMDPRTDDTDVDLVLDAEEIWEWRSNPNDQDSDDDGFADQTEVHFRTSLILADTDGDQLDDRDELLNRSRNPRIADLPIVAITVGAMNLELDQRYTYTDQFGEEHQVQESYSDTLQRDTSSAAIKSSSRTDSWHVGGKFGGKAGFKWGPTGGAFVEGYFEVSGGFSRDSVHASTQESREHTSRTYNEAVSHVSQLSSISGITREIIGARVSAAVTIGAASDIAFSVSDIEISALQQDPRDRSRLIPIAALVPSQPDAVYSVGPLVPEVGPLIFENTDIFPSMVEELMKDPRGVLCQVASFNVTDEFGRNFAFSGQEVSERTATVTIDFGNGQIETYRIATAGRFDMQGHALGISMEDALRAVDLAPWPGEDPELGSVDDPGDPRPKPIDPDIQSTYGMRTVTRTPADGEPVDVGVITRVRGVQDDFDLETVEPEKPNDGGFWMVFVVDPGAQGSSPDSPVFRGLTSFDGVRLHAGEAYLLAFVKDKDRDQLTSLEEFFAGSNDALPDTDGDLLGDFLELRGQWNDDGLGAWLVYTDRLPGGYRVYSAPYLSDSDEDELPDDMEYALCRYHYDSDGSPPADAFASGTYPDDLDDPTDDQVTWEDDVEPDDLPYAFPPSDGLPIDWHTRIDSETGVPVDFPSNRASLDPRKIDTDEDGLSDGNEVNGYYVDLFDQDPTDGLRTRVFVYSDPLNSDTDGDGLLDGMELQFGTNPASDDSGTVLDDDLDGLPNRIEETGWSIELVIYDPNHPDSDPNTGLFSATVHVFSDPDDPDSDNDNLPDYVEWVLGTSPWYYDGQTVDPDQPAPGYDSDQDGVGDYEEWDGEVPPQDRDRLAFCDLVPNCVGYQPSDMPLRTDPADADTDDDDLSDGAELTGWTVNLWGAPAGYQVFSDPLDPDTDLDSWNDGQEFAHGTDPNMPDTDQDGTIDPVEPTRVAGDPNDPNAPRRDPLTPDQRVTVIYDFFDVIAVGDSDGCNVFSFALGAWVPAEGPSVEFWLTQEDLGELPSCYDDSSNECLWAWSWLQMCAGSSLELESNIGGNALSWRSFIVAYDEIISVRAEGTARADEDSSDRYDWYAVSEGSPYTVPFETPTQLFQANVTVSDLTTQFEIHGRIVAD